MATHTSTAQRAAAQADAGAALARVRDVLRADEWAEDQIQAYLLPAQKAYGLDESADPGQDHPGPGALQR